MNTEDEVNDRLVVFVMGVSRRCCYSADWSDDLETNEASVESRTSKGGENWGTQVLVGFTVTHTLNEIMRIAFSTDV